MSLPRLPFRLSIVASLLLVVACQDTRPPTQPGAAEPGAVETPDAQAGLFQAQEVAAWFRRAAPEALSLPQTVFADHDEEANRLVIGVENEGAARGVERALRGLGIPTTAYRIRITEPIHFMATLRDRHRPTVGGIQIHFSNFLCTLGFSADHSGGRSFFTASHCSDQQGTTDGTIYYQPVSSVDPSPIGTEVDDPAYFKNGPCPRGRRCRYSDAARALYESGIVSPGEIARTSGANSGSLEVLGSFDITAQANSATTFSGTLNKVGRTTGWTEGDVTATCATVNVSGSNITLLCQTLVEANQQIVGSGDSGSPVFKTTGTNTAELVGILWGGSSSGNLFVFSPLKNIQDELGSLDATTDGTGGDIVEPPPDGGDDGGGGGGNCPPGNPNHKNCQ